MSLLSERLYIGLKSKKARYLIYLRIIRGFTLFGKKTEEVYECIWIKRT